MSSFLSKLLFPYKSHQTRYRSSKDFRAISRRFHYEPYEEALYTAIDYAQTINSTGDYLEFGVWRGRTFITAYHMVKSLGQNMEFYAFDSFKDYQN